jgi:hypothetical protein
MPVGPETIRALSLPPAQAIDFLRGKTGVTTQHWTDLWRGQHSRQFMVAGAATEALVSDFQAAVQGAIEQGTTLRDFRKSFDGIVAKHGWVHNGAPAWRARIIYETNLSMAYSAGRYQQMSEPDTLAVFPFWQYVHSGAAHPRQQHQAWNGLTLRADDEFWKTHYPPNGWRCGCRVRPLSSRDMARQGRAAPDAAPPVVTRPWTNPRTGQTHQVPEGIDPGFDYNPGAARFGGPEIPADARLVPPANFPPPAPLRPGERPPGRLPPAEPVAPPAAPPAIAPSDAAQQLDARRADLLERFATAGLPVPPGAATMPVDELRIAWQLARQTARRAGR